MKIDKILVSFTMVALLLGAGILKSQADGAKGGASLLLQVGRTAPKAPIIKVEKQAMSCPGCADTAKTVRDREAKGGKALLSGSPATKVVVSHDCSSCQTELLTKGHGRDKVTSLVHLCGSCR